MEGKKRYYEEAMESMTGYAVVEKSTEQFSYSIELKSLNSKYLETSINMPRILKSEENEIEGILKKSFYRGKLECNIEIYEWVEARPVSINGEMMVKYFRELNRIAADLKYTAPIPIESVLGLDGVVSREKTILTEKSKKDIYASILKVVEQTHRMRRKEGVSTRRDVTKSLDSIAKSVQGIKKLSDGVSKVLYEKLVKRIELIINEKPEDTRLYTEVAILADKQDINEELVRLADHIVKFKQTLKTEGPVGKQLDFLCQEMFREVNTIASKSNNTRISHLVVDIKSNIDKIREQCRNIV